MSDGLLGEYSWPSPTRIDRRRTVWHYTDANGVLGIMRSNRLWATAANMLNDSSEIEYGIELAKHSAERPPIATKVLERVEQLLVNNDVFVACASLDGDSLAQWRGYAGAAGYSMGLSALPLRVSVPDDRAFDRAKGNVLPSHWLAVTYDPTAQRHMIEKFWRALSLAERSGEDEGLLVEVSARKLSSIVVSFKHRGFASEQEVRLAFDSSVAKYPLDFRSGPNGLTPFVNVAYWRAPGRNVGVVLDAQASGLPVTTIRVGPQPSQATAANGVGRLVADLDGSANIEVSTVPFR